LFGRTEEASEGEMEGYLNDKRLSWAAAWVGLVLELLIGLGGWAVGWMLLRDELGGNVNLVVEFFGKAEVVSTLAGGALGIAAALLLRLMIRLIPPLQKSRSLRVLSIIDKATWLQIFLLCLVAGVAEEMLFRGALQQKIGIWPAAVLFGLLHAYGRLYVAVAIFAGAGLGYLYLYTGSLAAVAAAHALYNLAISVLVKVGLFPLHEDKHDESDAPPDRAPSQTETQNL
jgi:membrane protease YdiL (CAAX protease family)